MAVEPRLEFSTHNTLLPDSSWAAWPLQAIGAVIADQKFNIRLHRLTCTRFHWMFVWGDQPDKTLVNIEQHYTLSLPAVCTPAYRIATVAVDLAVFNLATSLPLRVKHYSVSLPVQVTTLSILAALVRKLLYMLQRISRSRYCIVIWLYMLYDNRTIGNAAVCQQHLLDCCDCDCKSDKDSFLILSYKMFRKVFLVTNL